MTKFISTIKEDFYFSLVVWLILLAFMKFVEAPSPKKANNDWVLDMTNILNDRTENQLNQMISQLNSNYETEIAVITVPEISPTSSAKEKYWEMDKVKRDNGVLFLISARDQQTEILTGYEATTFLPDEKVNNIINTQIIPQFKQKHFDEGALAGTNKLITVIKFEIFWLNVFSGILSFFLIFVYVLLGGGGGGGGGSSGGISSGSAAGSCGGSSCGCGCDGC